MNAQGREWRSVALRAHPRRVWRLDENKRDQQQPPHPYARWPFAPAHRHGNAVALPLTHYTHVLFTTNDAADVGGTVHSRARGAQATGMSLWQHVPTP